jgi:PIN domain nuclease of toxin-antitoxin system
LSDEGEHVLDASALIALLWEEAGAESVEPLLGRAAISAVNWAEVLQRYTAHGLAVAGRADGIEALGVRIEPFTPADAAAAAELWGSTRSAGLSLGDRACLALARRLGAPAYTADGAWRDVDAGAKIVLIRKTNESWEASDG